MNNNVLVPKWQYIGIPILGAAMLMVRLGSIEPLRLLWFELLIVFGYIASVIDLRTKRIPNELVLLMLAAWVITFVPGLFFEIDAAVRRLISSILGFVSGGGIFLLVYLISRNGLGGGDVKFIAAAGLYLGFGGIIPTILFGTILAATTGIALIIMKKIGRKDAIPLAPFLYVGILITVFFQ